MAPTSVGLRTNLLRSLDQTLPPQPMMSPYKMEGDSSLATRENLRRSSILEDTPSQDTPSQNGGTVGDRAGYETTTSLERSPFKTIAFLTSYFVVLNPLVSLVRRLVACSTRLGADTHACTHARTQTHTHTHTHTDQVL